jgi:selenocysteine-specific elongation factor
LRLLPSEKKPINQWFPVRLHCTATEIGARIVLLDDRPLAPGGATIAQLVLDHPIAAAQGDPFVIRDVSAQRTLGGGRFLDLRAPARKRRTPERRLQLRALAFSDPVQSLRSLLAAPPHFWDWKAFVRDRAISCAERDEIVRALELTILESDAATIAMLPAHWNEFRARLLQILAAFHAENPDVQGVGRERLRLALVPRLPASAFMTGLQKLAREGSIALDGSFIRLTSHAIRLTTEDEALWAKVVPLLGGSERFRPPRTREIAHALDRSEGDIRRLLKLVARLGRVDEVAHDHFFLRTTVCEMLTLAAGMVETAADAVFTAAQFRDRVSNGRKVAIQILEFFDRHGVTLRQGDSRRINRHRLDLFGPIALGSPTTELGRDTFPVGRPDFKSGWGSETVPRGFDSHSLPPTSK